MLRERRLLLVRRSACQDAASQISTRLMAPTTTQSLSSPAYARRCGRDGDPALLVGHLVRGAGGEHPLVVAHLLVARRGAAAGSAVCATNAAIGQIARQRSCPRVITSPSASCRGTSPAGSAGPSRPAEGCGCRGTPAHLPLCLHVHPYVPDPSTFRHFTPLRSTWSAGTRVYPLPRATRDCHGSVASAEAVGADRRRRSLGPRAADLDGHAGTPVPFTSAGARPPAGLSDAAVRHRTGRRRSAQVVAHAAGTRNRR